MGLTKKATEELNIEKTRHKNRMEEIQFEFACKKKIESTKHDNELETHRIRNADIQRSIASKNRRYS